jgi:hypothetical protein
LVSGRSIGRNSCSLDVWFHALKDLDSKQMEDESLLFDFTEQTNIEQDSSDKFKYIQVTRGTEDYVHIN